MTFKTPALIQLKSLLIFPQSFLFPCMGARSLLFLIFQVSVSLLSRTAETVLPGSIQIYNPLCAVKLRSSSKVISCRSVRWNLFVVSAYVPTAFSSGALKNILYQQLHDLLCTGKRSDLMTLVEHLNSRIGRLSSCKTHLKSHFSLYSCRSENKEQFLAVWPDHRLFLVSINFKRSCRCVQFGVTNAPKPVAR